MKPLHILAVLLALQFAAHAAEPKPVPRMQAIPQPRDEVSFQRDGEEIARHLATSLNLRYIDRNHGSILIIWDRLFGTFEREGEPVVYGLTKNIETFNPVRVAYHEFAAIAGDVRAARTWRERLGYVFMGPGWTPATSPRSASWLSSARASSGASQRTSSTSSLGANSPPSASITQ